jgi:tetratricopeptide (TPR) repeat protein
MSSDELTSRGIAALRAGDHASARSLLSEALRANPHDAQAWLWISGTLPEPAAQRYCLERALTLDPANVAARRGLEALGRALAPGPEVQETRDEQQASRDTGHVPDPEPGEVRRSAGPLPAENTYANPWLTLWMRPRAAMRSAIAMRSASETWLLAALAGVSACLSWMAWGDLGDALDAGELLAVAIFVGPLLGVAALQIGGVLLRTGGWMLGGQGGAGRVRAALAWAAAPLILGLPLWVIQLILLPEATFHTSPDPRQTLLAAGGGLIQIILWLWAGWLSLIGLAEAHLSSIARAAAAWVAAALVVVVALLTLFGGAALIISLRGG